MIEIRGYRPDWPEEFERLRLRVADVLGGRAVRIDHIGSTSVPGLAAKDVIDVQVTVRQLGDAEALVAAGFRETRGFGDHVPPGQPVDELQWRKRFFNPPPGERPANIHVREEGRANQRYALLFRDYLRAHPLAADAYAELKRRLGDVLHDRGVYAEVKDPACDLIWVAAEEWAETTGWQIT
jgi:GrpB-like predicted nucleotidyltransferase (UPF0157 family)